MPSFRFPFAKFLPARFLAKSSVTPQLVRGKTAHVIILDGTMSSLEAGRETNAGLTYKCLSSLGSEVSVYYERGLQWARWMQAGDVIFGRGINRQIRRAYGYLASRFHPGDTIYFFGFSRGAFAVRSLAGMIDKVGLLTQEHATERQVRQAYRLYQSKNKSANAMQFKQAFCHEPQRVQIQMIGVWDTVKSLGIDLPILRRSSFNQHSFHNPALNPTIQNAYHALARHETRKAYAPVMWQTDPQWAGHMEQMWFRGAHGDVGGELDGRIDTRPLSNIPLVWMLEKAQSHGLPLPENWQESFPQNPKAHAVGSWRGYGKLFLNRQARQVGIDPSERVHPWIHSATL